MHFIQPDTLIPDLYNPQSLNRYAYVNNNPIRYTDPSGHSICENGIGACAPHTEAGQISNLKIFIEDQFDWNIDGDDFALKELETIYQVGLDIEAYVDGLSGGNGQEWMLKYLGNITITHDFNRYPGEEAWTFPTLQGTKIWLGKEWMKPGGWDTKQLFAHELGHVWDIRTGFNAQVQLYEHMGGKGFSFPFRKPDDIPQWDKSVNGGYGNGGLNDYTAESFSWTIYNKAIMPSGASDYIDALITNQASP